MWLRFVEEERMRVGDGPRDCGVRMEDQVRESGNGASTKDTLFIALSSFTWMTSLLSCGIQSLGQKLQVTMGMGVGGRSLFLNESWSDVP